MTTTGQRIKHLRKTVLGLSQAEMGKIAEVSKSAVSQWEREITIPERDPLLAMQRNRNINPEWVKNDEGEMFNPQPQNLKEDKNAYHVTPENAPFFDILKKLDSQARHQLLIYMEGLLAGQGSRAELNVKTPHSLPPKNKPKHSQEHEEK